MIIYIRLLRFQFDFIPRLDVFVYYSSYYDYTTNNMNKKLMYFEIIFAFGCCAYLTPDPSPNKINTVIIQSLVWRGGLRG